jgi:sodium transport system permease protein
MKSSRALVVYAKELRDLLRDRRTIISMVVIPVLVIPVLMLAIGGLSVTMIKKAQAEVPKVMVLGEENAPSIVGQLRGTTNISFVPASEDYTNLISNKRIRAAVEIPPGFEHDIESGDQTQVKIYIYEGEIKSQFGARALQEFFSEYRTLTISNRLAVHDLSPKLLKPFDIVQQNVAPPKKVSGNLIGGIIPYIIILMSLTGAMYPAMDLTAGEKERGTIETLLCSPASRLDLVLGKFLMVLTAAMATTFLSLASMGTSFLVATSYLGRGDGFDFPLEIDLPSLIMVFIMMLPLAVFFSALLMVLALFARSYKEAQSYVSPLMIVVIMPAVASLRPGVELSAGLSTVPILNVSLASKAILSGTYDWGYLALILCSSTIYAALALWAAVKLFQREEVMFRS